VGLVRRTSFPSAENFPLVHFPLVHFHAERARLPLPGQHYSL